MELKMLRRFADGYRRPSPERLREWFTGELISSNGAILSDEAYILLREFFSDEHVGHSAMELSKKTFMDPFQVRSLCRQLVTHEILEESPPFSTQFRLIRHKVHASVFQRLASYFATNMRQAASATESGGH
jgi:hypothetical protein